MSMSLLAKYQQEVIPALIEQFHYPNKMGVPRLTKVVVNVGVGRMSKDKAFIDSVQDTLTRITGQKPILNQSRKSISAFKIREGMIVGVSVTLRGQRMYDFVEKLIAISLPRIRDFRGLDSRVVDHQGNLNLGFKECSSFPEVRLDELEKEHGLEISIATTAKTQEEGLTLFKLLGFPFKAS